MKELLYLIRTRTGGNATFSLRGDRVTPLQVVTAAQKVVGVDITERVDELVEIRLLGEWDL